MIRDLQHLFACDEKVYRWQAECENAGARRELAVIRRNMATLISQYDPLEYVFPNIDRNKFDLLLDFINHGDEKRLIREINEKYPKQG